VCQYFHFIVSDWKKIEMMRVCFWLTGKLEQRGLVSRESSVVMGRELADSKARRGEGEEGERASE
jgi:hypothetical protein